jgi:autotransporter passenger strand-loop-strand repeat protein
MTDYVVSGGQTSSGLTISAGDTLTVSSGGIAISMTIDGDGSETVSSGGTAISTTIDSGTSTLLGIQTVEAGGTAIGTTLYSFVNIDQDEYSGEQLVFGVASGTIDGGTMIVESGGFDIGSTITTSSLVGFAPGGEDVYGTASGTTIEGQGAQFVESGGLGIEVTVLNGGQVVYGVASATTLFGGFFVGAVAQQTIALGGLAIGAIVSGQGNQTIDVGGVASGTTVYSGGMQTVGHDFQNYPDALASGTTLSGGEEVVSFGGMTTATTILSGGIETVASGGISVSSVIAGSGALLDIQVFGIISGGVTFEGSGGQLEVIDGGNPSFTIYGLTPGDGIDLPAVPFSSSVPVATLLPDNLLQVSGTELNIIVDLQLDPAQNFTGDIFAVSPDSGGGTLVTEENPCFLRGTMILTPADEVAVESLHIGDLVTTAAGAARPIKWVGRRSYVARFAWRQKHLLPVCIKAGALADDVPRRDLWLSPNHGLYLDGVLIEACDLVNGASIVQPETFGAIEYFHIELDSHDVLISNGAAAESYIDDDNRLLFHNAPEYRALHPTESTRLARYCAPRLAEGDVVEGVRDRIARLAGLAAAADPRVDPQRFVAGARLR